MMKNLFAFISGLLFGLGLIISGMANPAIVQGFLDVMGDWNPALAWVMVGALSVATVAVLLVRRRSTNLLGGALHIPKNSIIDRQLVLGGLIFGVGWGMIGICPAPALVLVGQGVWQGILFAVAMLIGIKVGNQIQVRALLKSEK